MAADFEKNFIFASHNTTPPHSSTTLYHSTTTKMSDVLEPLKTAVLDHSKCVPDMHMGEKGDFEAWGKQFMVFLVGFEYFRRIIRANVHVGRIY